MSIEEYQDAYEAMEPASTRHMSDRAIAVETLLLLRGLNEGMQQIMAEIGPAIATFQNGPIARLLGGGR